MTETAAKIPRPKNKYRKGFVIAGWYDLMEYLAQDRYVYFRHKPMNPKFVMNMTLQTVDQGLTARYFREAINAINEYEDQEYQRPLPNGVIQ